MKGRWKWVWLFIGVLLISGTCGFGFEAKRWRTQFKEAKDAFQKRDWDRVADNLSDSDNAPSKKAFAGFMKEYVDPIIENSDYEFQSRETKSTMVPIKNETDSFVLKEGNPRPVAMLEYWDDAIWFDVPFSKQRYGIFKGKRVFMPFSMTFLRICRLMYPQADRPSSWKSVIAFVKAEQGKLTAMGLSPKSLYSQKKTWNEFADEYQERVEKWRKLQKT